jgi:four helix bundle protein
MFLSLAHRSLDVYRESQNLVKECYNVTGFLPDCEKFGMTQQMRRAAVSVLLNLAEGSSRRSDAEKRRFYEVSRSSIVEIDACLDLAVDLNYLNREDLKSIGVSVARTFQMLSKMINRLTQEETQI